MAFQDLKFDVTEFWVQASNILVKCMTEDTTRGIGDEIGSFVSTHIGSERLKWHEFLRIHILMSLNKPLAQSALFQINLSHFLHIQLWYERLVDFCYLCGLLDHKKETCDLATSNIPTKRPLFREYLSANNEAKTRFN
ncbi:hypothetical protein CDL12_27810 [Handroanthus impetiginosus]|uniref:Zinc knuckle CX2CX4HX4C domain-containing protein n=1 Tax=Handroanthus impetiginosus TaxID=429701 RepID=A0A2G9G3C5_9LAMI|nr:hypothetical protein CDL12_27810 [Handroanthus impetiginosus]